MKTLILLAASVCLAVAQDPPPPVTPVITWVTPGPIRNPAPLTVGQLNATASAPGTFVYDPAAGTVLDAGNHSLSVTFTPNDTNAYTSATATVSLEVIPTYWPYDPSEPAYVCHMNADLTSPVIDAETQLPRCFVVPVPVSVSLTKYMLTQTNGLGADGKPAYKYAGWWDFIVKYFINSLVLPMLDQYPPDELAQAKADAEAATQAVDAAKATLLGVDPAVLKGGGSISQPALRNLLTPAAPAPLVP